MSLGSGRCGSGAESDARSPQIWSPAPLQSSNSPLITHPSATANSSPASAPAAPRPNLRAPADPGPVCWPSVAVRGAPQLPLRLNGYPELSLSVAHQFSDLKGHRLDGDRARQGRGYAAPLFPGHGISTRAQGQVAALRRGGRIRFQQRKSFTPNRPGMRPDTKLSRSDLNC
jgi:hypothetical protein